jgi:hypothetical protein
VRTLVAARAVGHLADLGLDAVSDAALLKLLAALPAAHRALAERALARAHAERNLLALAEAQRVAALVAMEQARWDEATPPSWRA